MIDKIFHKIGSIHEINQIADNLRRMGMKEELTKLAEKNYIPKAEVKAFLENRRYFLVDGGNTVKTYDTARSKMLDEMFQLKDPVFGDIVGNYLLQHCQEEELERQILLEHKTLQRCIEYLMKQAYALVSDEAKEMRRNTGLAVPDDQVYGWIHDYYLQEDAEEVEKSVKNAEEKFLARITPVKPSASKKTKKARKTSGKKKRATSLKDEKQETMSDFINEESAETTEEKEPESHPIKENMGTEKKQITGQFSLFDGMMNLDEPQE